MKIEYKPLSGSKVFLNYYGELTNNVENLKLKTQKFKEEYEVFRMDNPTFSEFVLKLMKKRRWDRPIFKDRTLLNDSTYTRIINKANKEWEFKTIIAICVGLELHLQTTESLLASAGFCFGASKEHQAYKFLFMQFSGWPIDECNAFLESNGVPILGSLYKSN